MSFVFYGWWDWRFIFLILGSGFIDFFAGLGMEKKPQYRKGLLLFSLLGNLGSLALFKYASFISENVNLFFSSLGLEKPLPLLSLTLPVGISFYTFQSMSYTIDIYRGKLKPTTNVFHFFAYLAMFPQLVAGPIIRAKDILPQLGRSHVTTEEERWDGLRLIVHGFFKKVVIADNLAPAVSMAFSQADPTPSSLYWWVIISMFAFQIYCDFSGYSDIARGLARWMGYTFSLNFDHPYIASSIREFWGRWHISLSTWFRDYLYIPLGGSRVGEFRSHLNMWITMIVSGLWHGAAWTFVIWGGMHALYLSIERVSLWPEFLKRFPGGRYIATGVVIVMVWFSWVFFRAESIQQAFSIIQIMLDGSQLHVGSIKDIGGRALLFLGIGVSRELFFLFSCDRLAVFASPIYAWIEQVKISLMIVACIFLRGPGTEFIYFQF